MSLAKQVLPVAFREGIDTKTSKVNSIPGRLLELENGVFSKIGEIQKRYGFTRLSSNIEGSVALGSCDALATFRDELLMFSAGRLYSYSDARSSWFDRGPVASAVVTEKPVTRNTYAQVAPDVAQSGGLTCVAYEDSRGGVRYSITDTETGASIVADAAVSASGTRPRVVVHNSEFAIFYALGNNVFYRRVTTTDPTALGTEVNPIATLDPANVSYDIAVIGSRLYIAWARPTATSLSYFDASFALTAVTAAATAATVVAVFGDASENAWLLLSSSGSQRYTIFTPGGVPLLDETTFGTLAAVAVTLGGVVPDGTTSATAFVCDVTADVVVPTTLATDGTYAAGTTIRGVELAGKPFTRDAVAFAPCVHASALQSTVFVADAAGNVVAKGSPGLAGGPRTRNTLSAVSASGSTFTFAATVKTALESVSGDIFSRNGIGLLTLDFDTAAHMASAEVANSLVVSGGCPLAYDGVALTEQGFHLWPEGTTASVAAGGGGLSVGLVYRWRALYEWTDAQGQVHRSAPGPVTIAGAESYTSAAGSETVTLTIPTLRLTSKSGVRLVVFRTLGNGSIYFRLTPIATPTLNDKTADSVAYVDTTSDADLEGNEILYTDGSAGSPLDNTAPPPSSGIVTHGGRCFLVTGPNRVTLSQIVDEGEALAFSDADAMRITPDPRGGNIVALGSMDDKLVILKDSAIFATYGEGPDDAGGGAYPVPQLVSSDVGCSDARSVVLTSAGLMFKSAKGIYLLDRSLQVTYVGAPVEDYNGLTVTSAVMVGNQNQVRFTTSGSVIVGTETLSNIALVYDYAFNQWSVFTACGGVDAVEWRGVYTRANSTGKTYTEATDSHADDGAFVKLKLTTSWLSFAGVQGYQRIYRVLVLGTYKSDHILRVRLGYNFRPEFTYDERIHAETIIAPGTWGSDSTWGSGSLWGGNADVEWFQARPERQKCSAIRVSIEDSMDDRITLPDGSLEPYGAGFSISNLALVVGVKRGANKLPATRTI